MPSTYCRPADILPKVLPYCIPDKMMEVKRRPTLHDIRGSGYQLRHRHAPPDQQVPWNRVYFWPFKAVHVMTEQERNPLPKKRRKRVSKAPKVVKPPPTPVREKTIAAKLPVQYDYKRVLQYFKNIVLGAQVDQGAVQAASADGSDVVPTTTDAEPLSSTPIPCPRTLPGAILDDDGAAADVDAQAQSVAENEAQPSLLAAVFNFGLDLLFVPREPKRAYEDESEAGDAKRRRVGSDAQAPSRAEARPGAGNPARNTTGATAPTNHKYTATGARRRAHNAPKASLELCPPPAPVASNAKVVKARSLMPPPRVPARPIAGRPTRKRADTPDPRAPTPPPASNEEASLAASSPSSSRSSSPTPSRSPSPSPTPKRSARSSSKAKSHSSGKSESQRASAAFVSKELGPGEFLLPPYIEWSRDEFVNPWDPRAPAAPDPVYPWAPANGMWANARPAPIAPLPSARTPSFDRPVSLRELGRLRAKPAPGASTSSTATSRHAPAPAASTSRSHRSPSPAPEELSGEETEVESGNEDSDNED